MGGDLQMVQFHMREFAIGLGCWITTPIYKIRYSDEHWYRCVSLSLGFMIFNLWITIPLWKESQ